MNQKMYKDTEINKRFKIPLRTLGRWKKFDINDWRYKLYCHLKGDIMENMITIPGDKIGMPSNLYFDKEKNKVFFKWDCDGTCGVVVNFYTLARVYAFLCNTNYDELCNNRL